MAGKSVIPAYIRLANDQEMLEMALVENIQRQDLDAVEVALSYQRLIDECEITQEEMSKRVGKKRSTVTNYLRLLKLPPIIQAGIRDRMLSMGHARALVNVESEDQQLHLYKQILSEGLSVRQIEEKVKKINKPIPSSKPKEEHPDQELWDELNQKLSEHFKTSVKLNSKQGGGGQIIINYQSGEELERLLTSFNL
jgi:ParB family chromosome partitioning protein